MAALISTYRADWEMRRKEARRQIANEDRARRSEERLEKIAGGIITSTAQLFEIAKGQQEHFEESTRNFEKLHESHEKAHKKLILIAKKVDNVQGTVERGGLGKRGLGR